MSVQSGEFGNRLVEQLKTSELIEELKRRIKSTRGSKGDFVRMLEEAFGNKAEENTGHQTGSDASDNKECDALQNYHSESHKSNESFAIEMPIFGNPRTEYNPNPRSFQDLDIDIEKSENSGQKEDQSITNAAIEMPILRNPRTESNQNPRFQNLDIDIKKTINSGQKEDQSITNPAELSSPKLEEPKPEIIAGDVPSKCFNSEDIDWGPVGGLECFENQVVSKKITFDQGFKVKYVSASRNSVSNLEEKELKDSLNVDSNFNLKSSEVVVKHRSSLQQEHVSPEEGEGKVEGPPENQMPLKPTGQGVTGAPPHALPKRVQEPLYTLADSCKKTKTSPPIYYLPLTDEEVAAKIETARQFETAIQRSF